MDTCQKLMHFPGEAIAVWFMVISIALFSGCNLLVASTNMYFPSPPSPSNDDVVFLNFY